MMDLFEYHIPYSPVSEKVIDFCIGFCRRAILVRTDQAYCPWFPLCEIALRFLHVLVSEAALQWLRLLFDTSPLITAAICPMMRSHAYQPFGWDADFEISG
jgi:hypothetical protein